MAGTEFLDKFKETDESNLDISDATILKRERPKHQYTKELLMEMRTLPLSQRKPAELKQFSHLLIVASNEKQETKTTTTKKFISLRAVDDVNRNDHKNGTSKNGVDESRKPYDPKERLQKENQDIILSPQRRSFNTGCYISNDKKESATTDKQPSNNGREREIMNTREKEPSRRYNSGGRYVREAAWGDTHKNQNVTNTNSRDGGYNRNSNNYNRDNSQTYNRNNFDRKYFDNNQRSGQRDRRPYFNSNDSRNNYYRNHYTEEEPEWFNTGPITQDDTIELRGFDEEPDDDKNNSNEEISETNNSGTEKTDSKNTTANESLESSKKSSKIEDNNKVDTNEANKSNDEVKPKMTCNIDIEAFLKLDLLPDITMRGESAGSKFTRWFKRDEPNDGAKEETTSGTNLTANVCDIKSSNHLLDMLQSSKENNDKTQKSKVCIQELEATGKLHSVEEIELKLRGLNPKKDETTNAVNQEKSKKEEDSIAFQNLLLKAVNPQECPPTQFAQIFGQRNSSERVDPSPLPEIKEIRNPLFNELNKNPKDTIGNNNQHGGLPMTNAHRLSPLMMKNLQYQQDMLNYQNSKQEQEVFAKLMASANPLQPNNSQAQLNMKNPLIPKDILHAINNFRINDEVVQRPETYNIMKALQIGEITQYQLIEQLKKTTPFQSKFKESVLCILRILHDTHTLNISGPPGFNREAPTRGFQDNTSSQNIRMNTGNNGAAQREMLPNPQSLLQNAVLNRHLTDQKSNGFRGPSGNALLDALPPNSNTNNSNCTPDKKDTFNSAANSPVPPFSFTPTSVLRNIVTDKDVSLDSLSKKLSRNTSPTNNDQNVVQSPVTVEGSIANNVAQQQLYMNSMAQGNNNSPRYPNMINMMQRPMIHSPTPQNGIPHSGMMSPSWHNVKQMQGPPGMLPFQIPRGHLPPHPQMMTNANFNRKLPDMPMGLGPLITHPNGFIAQPIGPPPMGVNNSMVAVRGIEDMQSNQLNHWFSSTDMSAQQRVAPAHRNVPTLQGMLSVDEIERLYQAQRK